MKIGDIVSIESLHAAGVVSATDGEAGAVCIFPFGDGLSFVVQDDLCKPASFPLWTGTYDLKPSPGHVIMRRRFWPMPKEPVAVFDFQNAHDNPLTFWTSETTFIRPFRHFDRMDFGSIPLALQSLVGPTCAPRTFALHDSTFEFHAWWTERGLVEVTLSQADNFVYQGMRAEGCSVWLAGKARAGLAAGSWTQWPKPPITLANAQRLERASTPGFETLPAE
jgi:hypothetical protein